SLSDEALVDRQTNRSDWDAGRAQVILKVQAGKGTVNPAAREQLARMFRSASNPDHRLRAMWALHVIGGWNANALVNALGDTDEYVRAWAIQLLCEDRSPADGALQTFARMARED